MKYLFDFRMITLIITVLCTLQSWGGNDDIVPSTVNYGIDINNKYAYVTGGTGTHLVIDDYYQGYPVREINAFAFQNNNVIKTIQFPNTLKESEDMHSVSVRTYFLSYYLTVLSI